MNSNLPASIRQRLLNHAKKKGVPFDELLKQYGIERFLYRLSISQHQGQFVLKGAQLLRVWSAPEIRPSMDADFLGYTSNKPEDIASTVQELCRFETHDIDGLIFDPESVKASQIKEDAEYEGVRVLLKVHLDTARISLQVDMGFNDVISPGPVEMDFPTLLDMPVPHIRGYTQESVIVEKFEAMVILGEGNSRMKDFYDIRLLSRHFSFMRQSLIKAMNATFEQRGTPVPEKLPVLLGVNPENIMEKQIQWIAFRRRSRLNETPEQFTEVCRDIRLFLEPLIQTESNVTTWVPEKGWVA